MARSETMKKSPLLQQYKIIVRQKLFIHACNQSLQITRTSETLNHARAAVHRNAAIFERAFDRVQKLGFLKPNPVGFLGFYWVFRGFFKFQYVV